MQSSESSKGTGAGFPPWIVILAGIAALSATLLTALSVWLQFKNYRKPLLQRYVVRILLMVPIYSIASWVSLESLRAAFWIDPFRDVYEAFTIYAFFQLLINFIGGERALIIMMHGRPPVAHPWPLNKCFRKIDISDPHTFLTMKRGILQYTWVKPIIALVTIIMKASGRFQEGYSSVDTGYLWISIIFNISITVSLYALAMFWVCMLKDLKPFRPMPKFLSIKGIIFASYWQGFFLSVIVALGAFPKDFRGYTPDNLGAAIQDALICFEMPLFAIAHWYAFSWQDYADVTISAARMSFKFAFRDAFGPRDLIEDAKETFAGNKYEYRYFDAEDDVIAHEESAQRKARMSQGMRYARGGKGKYWIPQPGANNSRAPLLRHSSDDSETSVSPIRAEGHASHSYGATVTEGLREVVLDDEDEKLYASARALEFGDWNYPVITAHHASREDRLYGNPNVMTASTNRNILEPTSGHEHRQKGKIQSLKKSGDIGKQRSSSTPPKSGVSRGTGIKRALLRAKSSFGESSKSDRSQLVDLFIKDEEAQEAERARIKKSGNPSWNAEEERQHLLKAYSDDTDVQEENVREESRLPSATVSVSSTTKTERGEPAKPDGDASTQAKGSPTQPAYNDSEEANVWGSSNG